MRRSGLDCFRVEEIVDACCRGGGFGEDRYVCAGVYVAAYFSHDCRLVHFTPSKLALSRPTLFGSHSEAEDQCRRFATIMDVVFAQAAQGSGTLPSAAVRKMNDHR